MSDERERDILREIRSIYVGGDGVVLSRERLGIVVGHMAELETRIHDLMAERDQARRDLNAIFELTITDVMAAYDPEQIVHHVAMLRKDHDAARAELAKLRAAVRRALPQIGMWLEESKRRAADTDTARIIIHLQQTKVDGIRAALGIESEVDHE